MGQQNTILSSLDGLSDGIVMIFFKMSDGAQTLSLKVCLVAFKDTFKIQSDVTYLFLYCDQIEELLSCLKVKKNNTTLLGKTLLNS